MFFLSEKHFEKRFKADLQQEFGNIYILPKIVSNSFSFPDVTYVYGGILFAVELKMKLKDMNTERAWRQLNHLQRMHEEGGCQVAMILPIDVPEYFENPEQFTQRTMDFRGELGREKVRIIR